MGTIKKIAIGFGVFVVFLFLFGWYEVRPAVIKNKCSWVKMHEDAFAGRPAYVGSAIDQFFADRERQEDSKPLFDGLADRLQQHPAEPASPAKDWIQPANAQQYQFCLHNHGI